MSGERAADGLELDNVTVSYGRIPAVHHLSVVLPCGSCVALLGPNGAGKTTLLKAIAGLMRIESGGIRFRGRALRNEAPGTHSIAYLPQREQVDWDFPITLRGMVEMGRYPKLGPFRGFGKEDARLVDEALRLMDLESLAHRQIRALSGGQQQRAFLARAWAQQADIYLLDEPFTGLDRNASAALTHLLHTLRGHDKLVLASHHHLGGVPEIFDRVLILNGELIAAGPTAEAFSEEIIDKAFSVDVFTGG